MTLVDLLERAAASEIGIRLVDRREEATWRGWAEIYERSLEVAGKLREVGLRRGERVALVYPTCFEFFDAFFGALLAGAVPVPLYPPVRLGRLDEYHRRTASMLRAAGARIVLAEGRVLRLLGETLALARPELGAARLDGLDAGEADGSMRPCADDLALVQFSSGTTVDPKPVALTHRAILAQVRALNGFWPDQDGLCHSGVCWLPLYHDMGLIGCVFTALERPGPLTLLGPELFVARPALWLRTLSRYRATISPAPSFAYSLCVEKIRNEEIEGIDLTAWRVALNGAEPVAPKVLRRFQERFAPYGFRPQALTPVYGLSEASLAVTFAPLGEHFRSEKFDREELARHSAVPKPSGCEIVSVGCPLPGFEVRIDDGRVMVRGPSLMEGYLGMPEKTHEVLRDGWLDTGDLGFLYDGELFLTGRAKEVIILRGRNWLPSEIEQQIDGVDAVRRGCVVAIGHLPEGGDGERLLLFVERARDAAVSDEEIAAACRAAVLGGLRLDIDEVSVLAPGTLPRTSSGKLRRGETLRRYLAEELAPPDQVSTWYLGKALLRSYMARRKADA